MALFCALRPLFVLPHSLHRLLLPPLSPRIHAPCFPRRRCCCCYSSSYAVSCLAAPAAAVLAHPVVSTRPRSSIWGRPRSGLFALARARTRARSSIRCHPRLGLLGVVRARLSGLGSPWRPPFVWALVTRTLWRSSFVHTGLWFVCARPARVSSVCSTL